MDLGTLQLPAVLRLPGMEQATVHRDLAYGEDAVYRMDVYVPGGNKPAAPYPGIIFVHGGPISPELPLRPKDWGVFTSYGALAAASGMAGITFNHRLFSGRDQLPVAAADVDAAIDYVRAHAAHWSLDADRLVIWAFSGGGPLLSTFLRRPPSWLRGLLAFYAGLDLQRVLHPDMPADEAQTLIEQFSPLAQLEAGAKPAVPLLIARAGLDRPALNEGIDAFVQAALAAGVALELLNHPQGRHAFDTLDDVPRSREIIGRGLDFARQCTG